MEILLKYGSEGIPVILPDTPGFQGVLEPSEPAPVADPMLAVEESLLAPIGNAPLFVIVAEGCDAPLQTGASLLYREASRA